MRRLPLRGECADAVTVIDAFGFFETEDENQQVLREAARSLRHGGRLAMKVANGGPILDAFQQTDRQQRDGVVVDISREVAPNQPQLIERISIHGSRGSGAYERRQRLYRADELRSALERAGFVGVSVFASPDGSRFEADLSPAMWAVGERSTMLA